MKASLLMLIITLAWCASGQKIRTVQAGVIDNGCASKLEMKAVPQQPYNIGNL